MGLSSGGAGELGEEDGVKLYRSYSMVLAWQQQAQAKQASSWPADQPHQQQTALHLITRLISSLVEVLVVLKRLNPQGRVHILANMVQLGLHHSK